MHIIELLIHQFLQEVNKGGWKAPTSLLERFGESTVNNLKRQFEREPNKFTIRGSNIGRPTCQLLLEQSGVKGSSETNAIRNLYGDMVESLLMFVLYASGVPIIAEQELVSLELAGAKISGTLDIVIDLSSKCDKCKDYTGKCPHCHSRPDPRVWDIKSASDWSFKNKFNVPFEKFIEQDYFGYADQLFFYSTARGCKAGGWIVQNKSTGEIRVIEAPEEQRLLRDTAIGRMEEKVGILLREGAKLVDGKDLAYNSDNFKFQPVLEFFRKKPTGNSYLHDCCVMCDKKFHCFPGVQLKPRAKSEAKNPPLIWYTEYKE